MKTTTFLLCALLGTTTAREKSLRLRDFDPEAPKCFLHHNREGFCSSLTTLLDINTFFGDWARVTHGQYDTFGNEYDQRVEDKVLLMKKMDEYMLDGIACGVDGLEDQEPEHMKWVKERIIYYERNTARLVHYMNDPKNNIMNQYSQTCGLHPSFCPTLDLTIKTKKELGDAVKAFDDLMKWQPGELGCDGSD